MSYPESPFKTPNCVGGNSTKVNTLFFVIFFVIAYLRNMSEAFTPIFPQFPESRLPNPECLCEFPLPCNILSLEDNKLLQYSSLLYCSQLLLGQHREQNYLCHKS